MFSTSAAIAVPGFFNPVSAIDGYGPDVSQVGDSGKISGEEAISLAKSGDLTIIDVRSPAEWRQTGIPAGARSVTIHDPKGLKGFVQAVRRALDGSLDRPVALICASGSRSAAGQKALMANGFTHVFDVSEGMFGGLSGPGWLARNLPVEDCGRC